MRYILFNPISNSGQNEENIKSCVTENSKSISVLDRDIYLKVLNEVSIDDEIVIVGGDGTLNHFVNDIKDLNIECKILFNPAGTGNDFYNDIKNDNDNGLVCINKYINNLPKVIINKEERLFINGIGFGIDGYCCEVGDKLRAKSDKPVNYTAIAIKGLLFFYKAPNAKITVDGVTKEYKRVYIAPTMKGSFYGGGMNVAPDQDRLNNDKSVTNVVMYKKGRIKTLIAFPSIFKGELSKYKKQTDYRVGHHVVVEFDRPTSLQIDGETVLNVTKYEVVA